MTRVASGMRAALGLMLVIVGATNVHAQDAPVTKIRFPMMVFVAPPPPTPAPPPRNYDPGGHWKLMLPFYATTAIVQGLDAHSTFRALDSGGRESNDLVGRIAQNKPAFVAFKAGVAAAVIFGGRSIAKKNRWVAIAGLVGINVVYGLIVRNNYRVARAQSASGG